MLHWCFFREFWEKGEAEARAHGRGFCHTSQNTPDSTANGVLFTRSAVFARGAQCQSGRSCAFGSRPFLITFTLNGFSWLPQVSVMEVGSQRPKGREGALSSLNMAIEAVNLAKEVSSVTPAKAIFGSVSALLTMIKVRSPLCCDDTPQVHIIYPGLDDQRTGLHRTWVGLRRYLWSTQPGNEWKAIG